MGNDGDPSNIPQQVSCQDRHRGAGVQDTAFQGGGTLFTEPVLVVNQKAKIIELNNQYSVFNKDGQQVASVNQVGQSAAKKAMRLLTSLDQFMTHKLEVADMQGRVLLRITRPAKVMKSTVIVSDANQAGRLALSDAMLGALAAFARTGNPNNAALGVSWPNWPGKLIFDASASAKQISVP